ncbi:MAG: beta-galactosidase [Saccharofermentanales bacterium]
MHEMEKKLYYGAAYYPELWDEKTIVQDIRHMKELGINVVRMGEFAWAKMEPEEDKIDISFFVDIIKRINEESIKTIICTPTPTPPIWLSYRHPERMFINKEGVVMSHGARQHCCTNNDYFVKRTEIIVSELAKAVGMQDGVIGWQIDNEFKCHVAECFCEQCENQWHEWLKKEYKDIARLNDLWGTEIWSEKYSGFEQVPMPVATPFLHNASLSQAYIRFSREKINDYCRLQIDIIKKYSDRPITHNSHLWFSLDNEKLFDMLDFSAYDDYTVASDYQSMFFNFDFFGNLKDDKSFWLMETSPNHNGCLIGSGEAHPADFLRAETSAAYISGARGVSHWLWRQQRSGCEQLHGSALYSWGKPTTGYYEMKKAVSAKNELEKYLLDSQLVDASIAMTYSDSSRISFQVEPLNGIDYNRMLKEIYSCIFSLGINRDIITENHNFSNYKILLSPFLAYISGDFLARAEEFVRNGGTWIVGPMSGFRTKEHTVPLDAAFGAVEKIAGVETKFLFPFDNMKIKGTAFGVTAGLSGLGAVFENVDGEVLGRADNGIVKDLPFITEHSYGKGKIVMLGAMPDGEDGRQMIRNMMLRYAKLCGCKPAWKLSQGVAAYERINSYGEHLLFAVNMTGTKGNISFDGDFEVILGVEPDTAGTKNIQIPPYHNLIVKMKENLKSPQQRNKAGF